MSQHGKAHVAWCVSCYVLPGFDVQPQACAQLVKLLCSFKKPPMMQDGFSPAGPSGLWHAPQAGCADPLLAAMTE